MEDLTGKQLGRFQVLRPLGQGGMAAVYRAYQSGIDREVALKILPRYYADDPAFLARFAQEAHLIARLEHPHIVPVFDFGEADGYTFLAMRLVNGGTLADQMQAGRVAPDRAARIISEVADALDYAHSRGVIHRDVKPSNILLDKADHGLLSDFGLARILAGNAHLTGSGALLGTPAYMSPEQARGEDLDGRSDVYALGVIAFELLTGQPPYTAETPVAVLLKHLHDPLPLPRRVNPNLSEAVEQALLKALAKDRTGRFPTASALAHALRAALGEGLAAPTATLAAQTTRQRFMDLITPWLIAAFGWGLGSAVALSVSTWGLGAFSMTGVIGWAIGGGATWWALQRASLPVGPRAIAVGALSWAASWAFGIQIAPLIPATGWLEASLTGIAGHLARGGLVAIGGAATTAWWGRKMLPGATTRQTLGVLTLWMLVWAVAWLSLVLVYLATGSWTGLISLAPAGTGYDQLGEAVVGALVGIFGHAVMLRAATRPAKA